jgi:hypothetical protein
MKKYLIFTTILLSHFSKLNACGYYPSGEDIRYSLFLPEYFNYQDFSAFNYNANSFGFEYQNQNQYESNVVDWFNYTHKKVPIEEINECLNSLEFTDINSSSTNKFVQFLFKNKHTNTLQYLMTAKKCEDFNSIYNEDPWERNDTFKFNYAPLLKELNQFIEAEKSDYLKRKYAFITIRTAYYGSDYDLIKQLFKKYFSEGEKDYLYYWALYFNSFQNENAGIDIANIMAYSLKKNMPLITILRTFLI